MIIKQGKAALVLSHSISKLALASETVLSYLPLPQFALLFKMHTLDKEGYLLFYVSWVNSIENSGKQLGKIFIFGL